VTLIYKVGLVVGVVSFLLAHRYLASAYDGAGGAAAPGAQYSTNFPLTENPISEGGRWINGAAVGLDWADVQTTGGFAGGVGPASAAYADPTAIVSGTWGPNQTVTPELCTQPASRASVSLG
jgi:hypothetical protein